MSADFIPSRNTYKTLGSFRFWCQKVLPQVYDDSLSYYELLNKVVDYLNEVNENADGLNDDVTAMYTAFKQLQDYVNDWFSDLNVQEQVDNKIQSMVDSGTFEEIVDAFLQPLFDNYSKTTDATINAAITRQDTSISEAIARQDTSIANAVSAQNTEIDNATTRLNDRLTQAVTSQNTLIGQNTNAIDVLESRVDSITSLPSGSTTGDAELTDIRVAYTGATYASAGDAVRAQAENNHNGVVRLNNLIGDDYTVGSDIVATGLQTGYKINNVGVAVAAASAKIDSYPVVAGSIISVELYADFEDCTYIFQNTEAVTTTVPNMNIIGGTVGGIFKGDINGFIKVPEGATYLCVSSNAANDVNSVKSCTRDVHVVTDTTLSISGVAADAKATGDALGNLKNDLGTEVAEITVNKGTLVADEYVKLETGEFLSYGGWSRTDYLPCGTYTEIKINSSLRYSAFYDSNKRYISQANFQADTFLSVPQNAEYFAISGTSDGMASIVITAKKKGMGYILNEKIENVEDITITEKTESASSLIDGYLIADTGELASSDWVCTDYIDMPFDEKSGYAIRGTFYGIGGCAIYDKDNNMLLTINGNNVASYGGTTGSELQTIYIDGVSSAKKIRISGYKTKTASASDLWIKGNTFNGVYEHLYDAEKDITEIKGNISTTIASSKVLVIGDSISSDAYASYPKWVTVLKNQGFLPTDTTNSSQHATGFVARYNNQPNDFITRIKAIENPSQYDLVVVFGGINDYIQNIPMGEETGTDYTASFKPAVNEFFNYLMQNFTQARICVLLPLRTYATWKNSVNEYQQAYGDYIKQVAKSYCLPILNLTEDSGFCPYIATFSNMWTLLPDGFQSHDGVHPNEEYERRFLAPMIKGFLQGLM